MKSTVGETQLGEPNREMAPHGYNPYIAARREWDERYGSLITRAENWRAAAFLAGAMALVESLLLAVLSMRSPVKTMIVAVDSIGRVVAAEPASATLKVDDRLKRAALFGWVEDWRMVTSDPLTQRRSIDRVYAMLASGSRAQIIVTDFYRNHVPFARARTETVSVEVHSIVPTSPESYQIDWTETARDRAGEVARTQSWKAVLTIGLNPPTDEKLARVNPLGIYVIDASWSEVL
jgi:type IV secretion system protein VirB5